MGADAAATEPPDLSPGPVSRIDEQSRRLAEFFNGEVIADFVGEDRQEADPASLSGLAVPGLLRPSSTSQAGGQGGTQAADQS